MARKSRRSKGRGATGIFVSAQQVVATTLSSGWTGRRANTVTVDVVDQDVGAALHELEAQGFLDGRATVGIDPRWLYAFTSSGAPTRDGPSATDVLSRHLGESHEALVAGRHVARIGSTVHTRIVGCPRPLAETLYRALCRTSGPRRRLVPTPELLLEDALAAFRTPRGWVHHLRILPGDPDAIVLLVHKRQVVAWRLFEFRLGEDPWGIEAAVLGLLGHAADDMGISDIGGAVLHAGADADGADTHADLCRDLGQALHCTVQIAPVLVHDAIASSRGLARAAQRRTQSMDLFHDLHPAPGAVALFPYASAAGLLLTLGTCFFLLHTESALAKSAIASLEQQVASTAERAGIGVTELADHHERMVLELQMAQAFLGDRVPWSSLLREMPELITASTRLELIDGHDGVQYPLDDGGPVKVNRRNLLISCQVPVAFGETTPPEAAELAASLQAWPMFQKHLPQVASSDIQLIPGPYGQRMAKISLLALPGRP